MARYTLQLDDPTYERVKHEAKSDDRSIHKTLQRLIAEALDARSAAAANAQLSQQEE